MLRKKLNKSLEIKRLMNKQQPTIQKPKRQLRQFNKVVMKNKINKNKVFHKMKVANQIIKILKYKQKINKIKISK
jgi:hypothetical protein